MRKEKMRTLLNKYRRRFIFDSGFDDFVNDLDQILPSPEEEAKKLYSEYIAEGSNEWYDRGFYYWLEKREDK